MCCRHPPSSKMEARVIFIQRRSKTGSIERASINLESLGPSDHYNKKTVAQENSCRRQLSKFGQV